MDKHIMSQKLYFGDNLLILRNCIADESVNLIYIDPPFNTGRTQKLKDIEYEDTFKDLPEYLRFLRPRLEEAHRTLTTDGSFFLHLDYRTVHYCKIILDSIFGIECFKNEIIWSYDYGGRSKSAWPAKHDNILWYVKDPDNYTFNYEKMERIPYMAPGMVTKEKVERGKTLTDVWWHTIVHIKGKERVGYPTQKPLGILNRIVTIHSLPGDMLMDFFAGSGSFGEAAGMNNRSSILIDKNPDAIETMKYRLGMYGIELMENKNGIL